MLIRQSFLHLNGILALLLLCHFIKLTIFEYVCNI